MPGRWRWPVRHAWDGFVGTWDGSTGLGRAWDISALGILGTGGRAFGLACVVGLACACSKVYVCMGRLVRLDGTRHTGAWQKRTSDGIQARLDTH